MSSDTKFILLTLGEELLLGLTENSHLSYIGDQLRQGGATLHANLTLSDLPEDIKTYFEFYWEKADVLITTGGLGPTVDDRSKDIIAEAFGEKLIFDAEILKSIEERFAQYGKRMTPNNRKQAYRFKRASVLPNPNGTAPGLVLEKSGKLLIMLPGPPAELRPMFEDHVVPMLREKSLLESGERYLQIRTVGIGESALETLLQPTLNQHSDLMIAYCAHHGFVDFRLSFSDPNDRYDDLIQLARACRRLLGENFLCCGHDSLVKVVSDILKSRSATLSTAESCTGGLMANAFTNLPGSSDFFAGGFVAYSESAKKEILHVPEDMIQQHSVLSPEVAMAMASGAAEILETDYALSATGVAGPTGGSDQNPVGTVFVGLHAPTGVEARRFRFVGTRNTVKNRTLITALDWLRRVLLADFREESDDTLRKESEKILDSLK